MILEVVKYGHPVLRERGSRVKEITPEVTRLVGDMFETMYDAKGIGLAAQQVGVALQLTVIDVRGITDRPSTLEVNGAPADVDTFMPLVLINPKIIPVGAPVAGPEGCLSFPEIYADITRSEQVDVKALNAKGEPLAFRAGGLLGRAIQHEVDHLNGVLFIDRMTPEDKAELRAEIDDLHTATKKALTRKNR
ncbi:MAG TPA: peptide deformylase [Verrucomicrobiae bacterium]|nr:peptide deformylase [Verrucomicrobiae bacterium]